MSLTAFKRKSVINYGSKRSGIAPGGVWLPRGPFGHATTALKQAIQMLPRLVQTNTRIDRFRKEKLFIQLIENVHAKDAAIIIAAKDKKLHKLYPLVTKSLMLEAFPDLAL